MHLFAFITTWRLLKGSGSVLPSGNGSGTVFVDVAVGVVVALVVVVDSIFVVEMVVVVVEAVVVSAGVATDSGVVVIGADVVMHPHPCMISPNSSSSSGHS